MSYLDTLMSQTGLDVAPRNGVAPAASIVEVEAQQFAPAVAVESPAIADARPRPAPEPRVIVDATPPPPPQARTTAEPEPSLPRRTEFSIDASASASPAARTQEPAHAEIVIERRVTSESPPAQGATPREPDSAREREPIADAPRPHAREDGRQVVTDTKPARANPTFIEVRQWLAATPADAPALVEEVRANDEPRAAPETVHVMNAPRAAASRAESPRVFAHEARVELSIGTIQVVVEAPPEPAPASRSPAAPPPSVDSPAWSRLSRRYVRL